MGKRGGAKSLRIVYPIIPLNCERLPFGDRVRRRGALNGGGAYKSRDGVSHRRIEHDSLPRVQCAAPERTHTYARGPVGVFGTPKQA